MGEFIWSKIISKFLDDFENLKNDYNNIIKSKSYFVFSKKWLKAIDISKIYYYNKKIWCNKHLNETHCVSIFTTLIHILSLRREGENKNVSCVVASFYYKKNWKQYFKKHIGRPIYIISWRQTRFISFIIDWPGLRCRFWP